MNPKPNQTTQSEPYNVQRKPKFSKKQKIALAIAGIAVVGAVGGTTAYLLTRPANDVTTEVVEISGDAIDFQLKNGDNEITSGGVYNVTGSITGRLKVETSDEVKIILNGVSITNNDGQAPVKIAGSGTAVIELAGKNTLKTTGTDDPAAAISADYDIQITGAGEVDISASGKGIKAEQNLSIVGGNIKISSADDAIHSNYSVAVAGATIEISTSDDGIHADEILQINSGKITIAKSNEGLEAKLITINGGDVSITASDDGLNASGGTVSGNAMRFGGMMMDAPQEGVTLTINNGNLYVNSAGDGLDSNGSIVVAGGTTYVDGPTNSGNGAIDYNGEMTITGGTLVAVGASGMAQNASSASQPSVLINLQNSQSGELSFGDITYAPQKSYGSILISSDKLSTGQSYDLKINGQTVQSVSITNNITSQGTGIMGGGGKGPRP